MKKIIILSFSLSLTSIFLKADYWTQKSSYYYSICGSAGFAIGNTGYVGTGQFANGPINIFRAYSPATNTWASKALFAGVVRLRGTGVSIDSLGYIGLGIGANNDLQDWWQYSPSTNTWTQKADFGGGQTRDVVSFSIGSYGYVATGGTNYSNQLWRYDPSSNSWIQMTNFGGSGRQLAAGFAAGGKGYVGTGLNATSLNDFWEYNPANNSWSQKASLPGSSRWAAAGFSIGNKGYIGMGSDNFNLLYDFWEYDILTNQWSQRADYGGGVIYYTTQFTIGNKGYVGTGMDQAGNFLSSFWEYTSNSTTDIGEISSGSIGTNLQFTITPNPACLYATITMQFTGNKKSEITITDVAGKKMYYKQRTSGNPDARSVRDGSAVQLTIDIKNFAKGIYFVTIDDGKEKTVKKFIKE